MTLCALRLADVHGSACGRLLHRHEAEGVSGRISEHPRSLGLVLRIELRAAQSEHRPFGLVEVADPEVHVQLHGRRRVRPCRRLVSGSSLKGPMELGLFALPH